MKYFSICFSLLYLMSMSNYTFAKSCSDDQSIATLAKVVGFVKYKPKQSIKTTSARSGQVLYLCRGDKVITLKNSKAQIISKKGDVFLLDEESVLTINHSNKVTADEGVAYFMITKRHKANSFVVKAKFSTIGVKGTQFLVSKNENGDQVALSQGSVDVAPNGADFELFLKKEMAEFTRFKQQQESGFRDMKMQLISEFEVFNQSGQNYLSKGRVSNVLLGVGETISVTGDKAILDKSQSQFIQKKIQELKAFGS